MPEPWRSSRHLLDAAPRSTDSHPDASGSRCTPPSAESRTEIADSRPSELFTVLRRTEHTAPRAGARHDQLVILATGEVDLATAPLLQTALLDAVSQHPRVCCDLKNVTFFSAAGVAALLTAHRHALQAGSRFSTRGAHGITQRILHLTGVAHVFHSDPGKPAGSAGPSRR
jgi:anti-anti-sigma factor